jgi:glutathione S-transferase
MVLLHETGRLADVEIVAGSGSPLDPGSAPLSQNPLGKVPALERDDGPALYDSRVICRYLDHRFGGHLYPDPPRLWDALTLEATGDGILDAALLMVYVSRLRPEEIRMPDWVEGQWAKIARALAALDARWLSHLKGRLDIGHIAVGCALGYLDFRLDARNWRASAPGLADWYAGFAARPAMMTTRPPES